MNVWSYFRKHYCLLYYQLSKHKMECLLVSHFSQQMPKNIIGEFSSFLHIFLFTTLIHNHSQNSLFWCLCIFTHRTLWILVFRNGWKLRVGPKKSYFPLKQNSDSGTVCCKIYEMNEWHTACICLNYKLTRPVP